MPWVRKRTRGNQLHRTTKTQNTHEKDPRCHAHAANWYQIPVTMSPRVVTIESFI